jgi:hypothetical protein
VFGKVQRLFEVHRRLQQISPVSQRSLAQIVRVEKEKIEGIERNRDSFRSSAEGFWICVRCWSFAKPEKAAPVWTALKPKVHHEIDAAEILAGFVIRAYLHGRRPEEMQAEYPVLRLSQIYGIIALYLKRKEASADFMCAPRH